MQTCFDLDLDVRPEPHQSSVGDCFRNTSSITWKGQPGIRGHGPAIIFSIFIGCCLIQFEVFVVHLSALGSSMKVHHRVRTVPLAFFRRTTLLPYRHGSSWWRGCQLPRARELVRICASSSFAGLCELGLCVDRHAVRVQVSA